MEEMITNSERPIEVVTEEIDFYKQEAGKCFYEIGNRLIEAKAILKHGEWGSWLAEKVDFSEDTAQRLMKIAKEYSNTALVRNLGFSKALKILDLPPAQRDEFISEKHIVDGEEKTVFEMSKKELEKAIAEKKEAEKLIEELKQELETAKESEAEADALLEEAKKEIEQLKESPKPSNEEIAKLSDEQIAKIKAEEKEKQQKKIEKLNKTISALEEQKKAAEDAKIALEQRIENFGKEADKQKEALKEENESLKAKLKASNSSAITEFKLHFESIQGTINKMADCIKTIESEDAETAEKLKAAIGQLADKIKDII